MRKTDAMSAARLAAAAEHFMDSGQANSWDGVLAIRTALRALADAAESSAMDGGYASELENVRLEQLAALEKMS